MLTFTTSVYDDDDNKFEAVVYYTTEPLTGFDANTGLYDSGGITIDDIVCPVRLNMYQENKIRAALEKHVTFNGGL